MRAPEPAPARPPRRPASRPAVPRAGTRAAREPGRRERRKREVHERILAAAVALFDAKGPTATKVDEICAAADVAQKTFFNHFPSKRHLLGEIAERFLDETCALVEEARSTPGDLAQRLAHLFRRVNEEAERAGPMHRELLLEVVRRSQREGSGAAQTRRLHEAFAALLADAAAAGQLTARHSPAFLAEMAVAAFHAVMLGWVDDERYPLAPQLAETARFLARALAP